MMGLEPGRRSYQDVAGRLGGVMCSKSIEEETRKDKSACREPAVRW